MDPVAPELTEADPQLLREPVLSVLKVSWNLAWYDDIDSLVAHCKRTMDEKDQDIRYCFQKSLPFTSVIVIYKPDVTVLMQLRYSVTDHCSYSTDLLLTPKDKVIVRASYIPCALQQCIHDVENATSHDMVSNAIKRLHFYLTVGQKDSIADELYDLEWMTSLQR